MDSIQEAVKHFAGNRNFQREYERLKQQVLSDQHVASFVDAHPELSPDQMNKSLSSLFSYAKERGACSSCPGLSACPNLMQGFQPELSLQRGTIEMSYQPCELKRLEDKQKSMASLMKSYFIPKEILQATFENLYVEDVEASRREAIKAAVEFVQALSQRKETKGLYFFGHFGVGKTYLLGAIANRLAERGIESLMVHTPEFLREMKNSLSDGTFQQKMELLKTVPVLMFDDIGAENLSNWVRDEILGVILQYRMMEKLPTLYTSNYDFELLEEHLSFSQKGGVDEVKGKRIMERIRHMTRLIVMSGEINYRL